MLLGLASSGIHSNGYSLVRRVFADYTGEEVLPELEGKKLKDVLLEPTRIYVKAALPLIKEELVNGIAHITGGGFIENVPRMFSDDLAAEIDESKVPVLPIFKALENMVKSNMKKCLKSSTWVLVSCLRLNQKMWNVSKNFLTNLFMKSVVL